MALTGKTRYRTWWLGKQIIQVEDVMPSRSNGCREWRDATAKDVAELAASKGRNESVGAVTLKIDVDSKDARAEIAELTAMAKQLSRELEQLNRIGVPIGGARVEAK